MLVDLGAIYQQKMSLEQAKTAMATLGKMMVQLGMVEVTTQALGTILKGNAITYIAGGTVQGIGAAYLTRLAGLTLIEYFQEQEINEQLNTEVGGPPSQVEYHRTAPITTSGSSDTGSDSGGKGQGTSGT